VIGAHGGKCGSLVANDTQEMPMRGLIDAISNWLGQRLSGYLSQTTRGDSTAAPADPIKLMACIKPGDVLLVEGQSRVSVAIKSLLSGQ